MNFPEPFPQSVGDMDNHSLTVARNINLAVDYEIMPVIKQGEKSRNFTQTTNKAHILTQLN